MKENTRERWADAYRRGLSEGLKVRTISDLDEERYVVDSASIDDKVYEVTQYGWCSCEAAKHGDPVCKHRAVLHQHLHEDYPIRTPEVVVLRGDRRVVIKW